MALANSPGQMVECDTGCHGDVERIETGGHRNAHCDGPFQDFLRQARALRAEKHGRSLGRIDFGKRDPPGGTEGQRR